MNENIIKWVMSAFALTILIVLFVVTPSQSQSTPASGYDLAVDEKGNLRIPDIDYRKDWVALGNWAVASGEEDGGAEGIHVVYTQPGTVDAYRKTGKFPDGAVLIKELFSTVTDDMTTGTVSRADKTIGWFLMVKDNNNRFAGNKLWGDGWGWSYFDAENRLKTTSTNYKDDCLGCHVPVEDKDWIYTDGYPVLRN